MRRVCNQGGGIIVMAGAARDASRQRYDKCHAGARLSDERMRHAPRVRYIVWSRANSAARLAHAGTRKASRGALLVGHRREQVGLMLARKRIRQLEEIAIDDRIDLVEGEIDAMVGDAPLREIVRADALAAIAAADQALAHRGLRLLSFAALLVEKALSKHRHGLGAVA